MVDDPHRFRRYAGLTLILVVYVGGIIGWSCAVLQVSPSSTIETGSSNHSRPSAVTQAAFGKHTSPWTEHAFNHAQFTHVLQRFVDAQGDVNYKALKAQVDSTLLPYLQALDAARLAPLDRDARLALWINAYNAYTLRLIVDHYPVSNIQNIDGPTDGTSPFERPVGSVADTVRTLDEIEHEIIRKRFDEPRIHFALVCAARSCPRLRREAYTGRRLDAQLEDQAHHFLHSDLKNRIPAGDGTIALSRILKWYGSDFGPSPRAIQRALAPYFKGTVRDSLAQGAYDVQFLSYDWTLNDQSLNRGDAEVKIGS